MLAVLSVRPTGPALAPNPTGSCVSRMGNMVDGGFSPSQGGPGWEGGIHASLVGGRRD